MRPRFRKPTRTLTPEDRAELVRMRDVDHEIWQKIGRRFSLQDDTAKRIYDATKAAAPATVSPPSTETSPQI